MNARKVQPKQAHTPGPWLVTAKDETYGTYVYVPDTSFSNGKRIIASAHPLNISDPGAQLPNARLIAAAPELLSTCIYALEHLESLKVPGVQTVIKDLRVAIYKATGGAE